MKELDKIINDAQNEGWCISDPTVRQQIERLLVKAKLDEVQIWMSAAGSVGYVRYWQIQDRYHELDKELSESGVS